MKKIFAASVLTLAVGTFAVPAAANDYNGLGIWNQGAQYNDTASADIMNSGDVMSSINDTSAGSQNAPATREQVFEIKDRKHSQW